MKTRLPIAILLALVALIAMPLVALAAPIATPDTLTIHSVECYRHVLEQNDQLYIIVYTIDYTGANPPEDAQEAWLCRLMNGAVQLGVTTPYPYEDDGYAYGFMSIYFSAADAPAWGGAYTIRLEGNPTLTWVAGAPPFVTTATIVWYDEVTVAAAQERLTNRLRTLAWVIERTWGGTYDLVSDTPAGKRLTDTGEEYFVNVIDNLRDMCPDLFTAVMTTPDFPSSGIVQIYYTGGDDKDYDIHGINWSATSANVTIAFDIVGVDLKLLRVGNPGTVVVGIREMVGGTIQAADLVSGSIDGDGFTTDVGGDWEEITFSDKYSLTKDDQFAIVVRATGGNATNYVGWRADSTSTYTGGQANNSVNSGVVWTPVVGESFMFVVRAFDAYSLSYRNRLAQRLVGTPLDMTNLASNFNMSRMWMTGIVYLAACIFIAIIATWGAESKKIAMLIVMMLLLPGALVGFLYLEVAILATFMAGAGVIYVFWYEKTS